MEEMRIDHLLGILVFHAFVLKVDDYPQPQHGGCLARARQMQTGVCVVGRVV